MKFKVKRHRGEYYVEGRTEKNEELVYAQAQLVASGECVSLLTGTYSRKGKGYIFAYSDGHSIPFPKAVKRVSGGVLLEGCLLSLADMADEFEQNDLLMRRACFESELVFYDEGANRLKFAYAPVMGKQGGRADAMRLFSRLVQELRCDAPGDRERRARAADYFSRNVIFSAVHYRAFLAELGLGEGGAAARALPGRRGESAPAEGEPPAGAAQPSRPYDFRRETREHTGRMAEGGAGRPARASADRTFRMLAGPDGDGDGGRFLVRESDGHRWRLRDGRNVVGRSVNADIPLEDLRQISARHAIIEVARGQCVIADSGSTNGTYVNGSPLPSNAPYALARGDQVVFADVSFILM